MGIPILKIRRSRDRLIFNMGIPILERHLYVETVLFFFKFKQRNPMSYQIWMSKLNKFLLEQYSSLSKKQHSITAVVLLPIHIFPFSVTPVTAINYPWGIFQLVMYKEIWLECYKTSWSWPGTNAFMSVCPAHYLYSILQLIFGET